MTIEWLAGNRIRGTSAEKPVASLPSGSVGGWVELARHKLGSDASTIDVSWTPDKRYYMILMDYTQTSDFSGLHRLGNSSIDPNNNYHNRQSSNGGTDAASQATYVRLDNGWQSGDRKFAVEYIADLTNKEKLIMNHMARLVTTGASQVPQRSEVVSKWVPSTASDTVGKFQMMNGGNYASGSEVVVLGWDTTDTHTTNFWEELASVDLTGGAAATLSSGTFTAKKYLWVQYYTSSIASSTRPDLIFNSDTTSSYANRYNYNGTESEAPSENSHFAGVSANTNPFFANFFIINNSANEKLSIGHGMSRGGSGAGTAPVQRFELAQKWTNTSSQIANITLTNDASANFGTNTYLKVWGSD
jgi:hypothetical protein